MLVDAAKNWEASWRNVASIQDRVLKGNGKNKFMAPNYLLMRKQESMSFFLLKMKKM